MLSRHSKPKEFGGSSHCGFVVLQAASIAGEYSAKAPTLDDHSDGARYRNTATTWTWIVGRLPCYQGQAPMLPGERFRLQSGPSRLVLTVAQEFPR